MLADDVKLDLVSRRKAAGRRDVGSYFTNYGRVSDWYLVPAWLDGREVLAVLPEANAARPRYFIELALSDGKIVAIRDFRFVTYIGHEAAIEMQGAPPA
jgi:RNA polymerase sigma-70 factor (ECF subfamily)